MVLGGNGFIGQNLCNELVRQGYQVFSFDREMPKREIDGVSYIKGDFFNTGTIEKLLEGKDVVYHAISTLNPSNSATDYMRGYEKDFIQSIKLCELVLQRGIRLIFLSSGGTVYGRQEVQPIREDALPRPINHYGNIKLCIENMLLSFYFQNEADIIIARLANPYGPGQDYTKGVGFIDAAIKKALNGEKIEIWGNGNAIRDYLYIDDAVGMLTALVEYDGENRIFNLGSGEGKSINEVIDIIRGKCPKLECVYMPSRSIDVEKVVLDCTKIRQVYLKKTLGLDEGINKYYQLLSASNIVS